MTGKSTVFLFTRPVILRLFFRMLISYLLIALVSLAVFVPVVSVVEERFSRGRIESDGAAAEASIDNLDTHLQSIETLFVYLLAQSGFDRLVLVNGEAQPRDYVFMNSARAYLNTIRGANSLIEDIIVTFEQNDIVVTSHCVFDNRKSFETYYGITADAFLRHSKDRGILYPEICYITPMSAQNIAGIPMSIPIFSSANAMRTVGVATVILKKEAVLNALFSSSVLETGRYEMLNRDGISLFGMDLSSRQEKYTQLIAENSRMKIRFEVENIYYKSYGKQVFLIMLRSIMIGFVLSLVASFLSAVSATKPVRNIFTILYRDESPLSRDKNAYKAIVKSIDEILENNNRLKEQSLAAENENVGRAVEQLISGCNGEMPENARIPEHSVLCYSVFRPLLASAGSEPLLSKMLNDYIKGMLPNDAILHVLTTESLLILQPCEDEVGREQFSKLLYNIFEQASILFRLELRGAVGPLCLSRDRIGSTFEAAKLKYYSHDNQAAIIELTGEDKQMNGALSLAGQTELYHLLLSGRKEESNARIQDSFFNIESENTGMEQVFYAIRLVLMMVMEQKNISFHIRHYHPNLTPEENINSLLVAVDKLSGLLEENKRSHNERLLARILECIEGEFQNSELYNVSIAEKVGVSEKYLSNFVREQTGRTVSDLLQSRRIELAHELLVHSDKPISDIWQLSGFSSHNTFYKTIRRVYGVSPSELREMKKS